MEMDASELKKIAEKGEDSRTQFKADIESPDGLAAEIVSLLNARGGVIYVGIGDGGEVSGLESRDVRRINQMVSNVASQHVRNPVSVLTENIALEDGRVVVAVEVPEGNDKPYFDRNGVIWLKEGADKRRVLSKGEIRRFFESGGMLHADERPTAAGLERLDAIRFRAFFERVYGRRYPARASEVARLARNMNLADEKGHLNLAGLLLFGRNPEFLLPQFGVKAVRMAGNSLAGQTYEDSEDFQGTLPDVYEGAMGFLSRNLRKRQGAGGVNAPGTSEVPRAVLEEILVNALVHRDYAIDAPVRVLLFDDRIEVVSPGGLPDHLTVEKILTGNTNIRNPVLASFVAKGLLPYHGLGSGVMRAMRLCPGLHFADDRAGALFTAVIPRDGTRNGAPEDVRNRIEDFLRREPELSLRALAERLEMGLTTLQRHVGALKAEGRLVRHGGTRGRWEVVGGE